MDLDRFRDALRDALREEAAKIAARGDDRVKRDLFMLMQGAEHCLAKRLGFVSNAEVTGDDPKHFKLGWDIASRMPL